MTKFMAVAFVIASCCSWDWTKAADLGGDCCADLEERVAELEATTVHKGNKKVTVTLYGRVNRIVNFWDDGAVPTPTSSTAPIARPAGACAVRPRSMARGALATISKWKTMEISRNSSTSSTTIPPMAR